MYQLTNIDTYHSPPRSETYILSVLRTSCGLVSTASDQSLSLYDPSRLSAGPVFSQRTDHGNLSTVKVFGGEEDLSSSSGGPAVVCTAGENGDVAVWDVRQGGKVTQFKASDKPIISLACSAASNTIAVGSEYQDHSSTLSLWDIRSTPTVKVKYTEVHADDITTLSFHPSRPSHLLSGSTDGLVNIYDTTISDEDDVVIQTLNHNSSIHHAVYLTTGSVRGEKDVVAALSHDEQFATYNVVTDEEALEQQQGTKLGEEDVDFGDLRRSEALGCQYVADVLPKMDGSGAVLGVGAQERENFELVFLSKTQAGSWTFDRASSVTLPGAHGEEIVRSFCFYDEEQVVFTAGEDGKIKAWKPGS